MTGLLDYPLLVLVVSFLLQWLAARAGKLLRRERADEGERPDFGTVLSAELTLLALIIGFTFSMAVSRYDLRKTYEEAEANAIGTEYVRADFLPSPARLQVKALLASYTQLRIQAFRSRSYGELAKIRVQTGRLQGQLWSATAPPASAQPNPVLTLVASGMNDVLNSQGYSQAAAWNRIPIGAWILVFLVAVACNFLLGLTHVRSGDHVLLFLPMILSLSLFLIADIDSPATGIIQVVPENLIALNQSLTAH
jgi:hypothetical protein